MINKNELLKLIKDKEDKNYKSYKNIYISPKWMAPNHVFDELGRKIFNIDSVEKGWLVVIVRHDVGWALDCDYLLIYDNNNILEEISADTMPKGIKMEEIFV
jgi:hypothetical protein